MQIDLYSGRTIYLKQFYQWQAVSVLEGYPNDYINRGAISTALKIAEKMHSKPHLFAPKETVIENVKLPNVFGRAVEIPSIACAAKFRSQAFTGNEEAPLYESYCSIVWFQEEYGLPIDEEILEKIKSLHWESIAKEYEI